MDWFDKLIKAGTPLTSYSDNEDTLVLQDWLFGTNTSGLEDYYDVVFSVGGYGIEQWFEDIIEIKNIKGWDARRISSLSSDNLEKWYRLNGGSLYITPQTIKIVKKVRK